MAQADPNVNAEQNLVNPVDLFNALKIPDAIKDLPKFNGNPRLLHEFIRNVEEILTVVNPMDGTPQGRILLRAIRNKIEGSADEVLNMFGTPLRWLDIKNNLILHYADKRNETSLIRDLHGLYQGSDTVEKYYSSVIEILSSMCNQLQIHEQNEAIIAAKTTLFNEMCLNTFLSGLKDPLGPTIRAMKPSTLSQAFSFCITEQNIFYAKRDVHKNYNQGSNFQPQFHSKFNSQQNRLNDRQFFQRPFNNQNNFNRPMNNQNNSNRPFIPQRVQNNYPNHNNQMQRNTGYQFNRARPEPMEIASGNSRIRSTQFNRSEPMDTSSGNNRTGNNFRQNRQMFSTETSNETQLGRDFDQFVSNDSRYYPNLDQFVGDNEVMDANFLEVAAKIQNT